MVPAHGSKGKKAANSPAAREAILTVTHVADSHLVQTQDAYVTSTLLQKSGRFYKHYSRPKTPWYALVHCSS